MQIIFLFLLLLNFLFCGNSLSKNSFCSLETLTITEISQSISKDSAISDDFEPVDETEFVSDTIKISVGSSHTCVHQENSENSSNINKTTCLEQKKLTYLRWILAVLVYTIIAGIFVRYDKTRRLRGVFLLLSLFILGFYHGGCWACPIDGIQNFVLFFFLPQITWHYLIWFIGIILITYLFGKVWCGWVCHLGALQEFLYFNNKFKYLKREKTQKVLRIVRSILLVLLILQLILMTAKYWCRIDPFVNVFSFRMFLEGIFNGIDFDLEITITFILTILLLITSVFIYRPFCRILCPVGLILGWITYIPGASIIGIKGKCIGCNICSATCNYNAIVREEKKSIFRNSECISCGDCIDACKQEGLTFMRKNKNNKSKFVCENQCYTSED